MQSFASTYMQTLSQIYDTERQIAVSLPASPAVRSDTSFAASLIDLQRQSNRQVSRLEGIFRVLYREPRGEASWVATALLRQAFVSAEEGCAAGCAAALLALTRYELTLYESLLRWSEQCDLTEALPVLRRCLAEEFLQASNLAECAFGSSVWERRRSLTSTARAPATLQ